MNDSVKSLALLTLLCGALAVLVPGPAVAAGAATHDAVPCWKQVLNDWYVPPITGTYKTACYVSAIHHLPRDLVIYSSAKIDIQNAENAEIKGLKPPTTEVGDNPTTSTTSTNGTGSTTTTTTTNSTSGTGGNDSDNGGGTPTKPKTGIAKFLEQLTPGNPDSFPLPLLILGALAIVLIAAGGVGMLWQRSHPRTDPPAPA